MKPILIDDILEDIRSRLNELKRSGVLSGSTHVTARAKPRIFQALTDTVQSFCSNPVIPTSALQGFMSEKLFKLVEASSISFYDNLVVYQWPAPAFLQRDGGILHLVLNGKSIPAHPLRDPDRVERFLPSLQQQAGADLLYGPAHRNALMDLNSRHIYIPEDVTGYAKLVESPKPIRLQEDMHGYGTLVITGKATSSGTFQLSDGTTTVSVEVENGDAPEKTALALADAVNESSAFTATAVAYTDEVRFTTKTRGSAGDATLTVTTAGGVTVDKSTVALTAAEPTEIPIDIAWHGLLVKSALNEITHGRAGYALSATEAPQESEEQEAEMQEAG